MSNKKEFYIQNKDGKFFTYITGKNTKDTQKITGLKAGEWYAFCGGSSQVYIIKATFTASVPSTKHIIGNDSTQVIRQTETLKPINYFTKYASKGETKLVWDGNEATGITLSKQAESDLGDTLVLAGKALCPVGEYKYAVVATYNGVETSRARGKFFVTTEIKALTDTIIDAYQEEQIDEIRFRCYAYEKDSVTITWKDNKQPEGIDAAFNTSNYIFSINGTPTAAEGTYEYKVSVKGGNSIPGKIFIRAISYDHAIMYLYKNNRAQDKDNAYKYLTDEQHKNIILRRSDYEAKLRPADQYEKYDFILVSSDVDADNEEVLDIIRGKVNKPVLNMKAFTYAPERVDSIGWGEPDHGSLDTITNNGKNIYIHRNDHPIFEKAFSGKKHGDAIRILNENETRGLMPIKITNCPNSLSLATAYTRNKDDYYKDGELQTILHEIPAGSTLRNGNTNKYICFPLSSSADKNLTDDGKKLLDAIVSYLLDNATPSITPSELAITDFTLNGVKGVIDGDSIVVELNAQETDSTYQFSYTLADPVYTHLIPARGDSIDFTYCRFAPVGVVVTDYINRRPYDIIVHFYSPQGIDEVYTAGEWVNIYDVFGRMITTTNQDIYTMDLPRGMYIVVTAKGETIKIMR